MGTSQGSTRAERGEIETLPSGSLRVRVYAGKDAVTGKRNYLTDVIPAGPKAMAQAIKVRTKFLAQVDQLRTPRTRATISQLLDRYFELADVETTTLKAYKSLANHHIRPLIGEKVAGSIDGETLDSFYKQLRTCRAHCRGKKFIEHRTNKNHECDDRCKKHRCSPLADASIVKIQAILGGAGKRGVRWEWFGVNPFDRAERQAAPKPQPSPPTAEQAAAIVTEAWADLGWGMLVWLAMVTGRGGASFARRNGNFST
ncbi:phage integrase [Alloactinosynnema sp. L-07]|uniref:hypothetical protein n=1 Tax=Alloactinosynnema sp. L-07 TaxID=1653480 RepID=UPI00065EF5D9|nr:hypothetical protein [Alloactinosynnema sp. L-07]CRK61092.1 phage integrase [Alloactinosynnema sp. L-07]